MAGNRAKFSDDVFDALGLASRFPVDSTQWHRRIYIYGLSLPSLMLPRACAKSIALGTFLAFYCCIDDGSFFAWQRRRVANRLSVQNLRTFRFTLDLYLTEPPKNQQARPYAVGSTHVSESFVDRLAGK